MKKIKNKKTKVGIILIGLVVFTSLFLIATFSTVNAAQEKILIYVIGDYHNGFDISENLVGYDVNYVVRGDKDGNKIGPDITNEFLSSYDQVWLINGEDKASLYLTNDEKQVIYNFRENGGDLLISVDQETCDNTRFFNKALNEVANHYGVDFSGCWRTGSLCLTVENSYSDGSSNQVFKMEDHPFWTDVKVVSSTNSDAFMSIDATNPHASNLEVLAWIGDKPYGVILLDEGETKGRIVFDNSFARFYKGHSSCLSANDPRYHKNVADWLAAKVPACNLTVHSGLIASGGSSTLEWSSKNALIGTIEPGIGNIVSIESGSINVSPSSTTRYVMTVTGVGGSSTCQTTVRISQPLPIISGPCHNLVPCKDNCTLNDLFIMLHNIVDCLVYLATIICLLFIVIGGLLYIFSLGNPEMLSRAKNTILWAIGGLALVFLAWLIINTIMVVMGVQESFLMWWG